ncbi:hypothetical protein B0H63DRAFT_450698 [Podospora didyma]|uniref:Uncharacterized protein n=1 Tax=Podospora didyma TaxID=330526 RepID=A0AAE0NH42_9PEZI|nr:hypothetical protein B0H63DRAFT_450698 [Podospora didyma]
MAPAFPIFNRQAPSEAQSTTSRLTIPLAVSFGVVLALAICYVSYRFWRKYKEQEALKNIKKKIIKINKQRADEKAASGELSKPSPDASFFGTQNPWVNNNSPTPTPGTTGGRPLASPSGGSSSFRAFKMTLQRVEELPEPSDNERERQRKQKPAPPPVTPAAAARTEQRNQAEQETTPTPAPRDRTLSLSEPPPLHSQLRQSLHATGFAAQGNQMNITLR